MRLHSRSRPLGKERDAGENLIRGPGPCEGSGTLVVDIEIFADSSFQFFYAAENPAPNAFVGDFSKPPFHKVDPGAISRREMEMEARPFGKPFPDGRGFMRAVVVENDVDVEFCGHVHLDGVQKPAEFLRTMATMQLSDNAATLQVERGKQRRCAMAFVVVGTTLDLAGPQRQHGLCAVQSLNLAFLVHTEDQRMVGWIHVETDDIPHFLNEQRVGRELEGLAAMRL